MLYNEVEIKSAALGGSTLLGTINLAPNPRGSVLFSHNASGSKDDPVLSALEHSTFQAGFSTLKYDFHYLQDSAPGSVDLENISFPDVLKDFDAAYSTLLNKVTVSNVYLVGKSLGGVTSLAYSIENSLKNPIIILGFFEPWVMKYIGESKLRDLKAPVCVIHGERDEYTTIEATRALLGKNRVNSTLYEIKSAQHGLKSFDESVRTSEDIFAEVEQILLKFLTK